MQHHPTRIILHARQAVRAYDFIVAASNTSASATSAENITGSGLSDKALARATTEQYNDLAAKLFNMALLLGLAAFFLCVSPSLSSWTTSGQHAKGWWLSKHKGPSEDAVSSSSSLKLGLTKIESFTSINVQMPAKIKRVSATYALLRYWYNRLLLPSVPLFALTRGQVLVALAYQALVIGFMFLHAGNLQANFKRFGYMAVAQLPAVFLLVMRNSLLALTGKGYERLNFLHRAAGRMILVCGVLHAGFYFRANADESTDFRNPTIVTGLVAMSALAVIFLTSLTFVRKAFYQLFLVSHILGWLILVVSVNMHAKDVAQPYIIFAIAMYLFDHLVRLARTRYRGASLIPLSGGMAMLQVQGVNEGWRAGQHVIVRVLVGRRLLEAHPFTIANAPKSRSPLPGQHQLTVLAKSTGDWTRALFEHAESQGSLPAFKGDSVQAVGFGKNVRVTLEGPYGGLMYKNLADSQAVLLIAGGSGITSVAALLEDLIRHGVDGTSHTRIVSVAWIMKSVECTDWYQEMFQGLIAVCRERTSLEIRMQFFITGPCRADYLPIPGAIIHHQRPDVPLLVDEAVSAALYSIESKGLESGGGLAVSTCGPETLIRAVRCAVARVPKFKALKVGGIDAHSEGFSL